MTDFRRIFLDTAPFIYYIEEHERYYGKVDEFLVSNREADFVTSTITVGEYLTMPYRRGESEYGKLFYRLLERMEIETIEISREIADKAARIRAEYHGFKLMDAMQLATAVISDCDLFLTNDRQLKQFVDLEVRIVEEC